jgi:spermidine/putrescine transport system ATP-binding protein
MVMSDRLAVMSKGKIEQVGTPAEVYDHPATEFVASFLGVSNLLPGQIVSRNAETATVKLDDGTIVAVPTTQVKASGTQVKIGVRPEKFHILEGSETPAPGWNEIEVTAGDSVYLGVSHQYMMQSRTGLPVSVYAQNSGRGKTITAGEKIRLSWHPAHTFVIEPEQIPSQGE